MATKKTSEKTSAKIATIGPDLLRDSKTLPAVKNRLFNVDLGSKKEKAVILLLTHF